MPHRLILTLLVLFALASASVAKEIVVTGNISKVPKIYEDNGEAKGILIDIARYIDERLPDYEFRYELYPWARAYHEAEQGEAAIIGLSKCSERLAIFDYSDPVYYDEVILVVRRGNEFPFSHISDLKGKVVGIGRQGSFGDDFESAVSSRLFTVSEDNGDISRLRMLLARRIDVALISPGREALARLLSSDPQLAAAKDQFVALPSPLKRDPNHFGLAKEMQGEDLLRDFNAILRRGKDNGDIQAIIDSYR